MLLTLLPTPATTRSPKGPTCLHGLPFLPPILYQIYSSQIHTRVCARTHSHTHAPPPYLLFFFRTPGTATLLTPMVNYRRFSLGQHILAVSFLPLCLCVPISSTCLSWSVSKSSPWASVFFPHTLTHGYSRLMALNNVVML